MPVLAASDTCAACTVYSGTHESSLGEISSTAFLAKLHLVCFGGAECVLRTAVIPSTASTLNATQNAAFANSNTVATS